VVIRLLAVLLSLCGVVLADVGKVVGVHDGDTLTVLTESKESVKIRIFGIDAPEIGQPYGNSSKQALSTLVYGRLVDYSPDKKDFFGRIVSKVHNSDGEDVGLIMIQKGMAWYFRKYAKKETVYGEAQEKAKEEKLGLWNDPKPIEPWSWRKLK